MSRLGRISEFDPKTQNIESYLERFEHFLVANDIKDEKVLPVFLTVIGPEAYEVLKSLVVPASPGEKSYAVVKQLLIEHYSPKSSVIAERCKFNRRVQDEHESVEDFIVELKHLARKCDFGNFLQDALRDRLVAGIRNEESQRALFAEENLTFEGACKIALDRELAARDTALMQSRDKEASLNAIKSRQKGRSKGSKPKDIQGPKKERCERCGRSHASNVCWYKSFVCRKCSRVGHLQKMCPNTRVPKNTNALECSDEDTEHDVYHFINTTQSCYEVSVQVEGKPLIMQIDTGAAVTIVPESVYDSVFPHVKCGPAKMSLRTYTGEHLQLKGQCDVAVVYKGQSMTLPVVIVKDNGRRLPVLLGRNWLQRLRLDWHEIGQVTTEDRAQALQRKYPSVFSKTLGTIQKFEATILLKSGSVPVFSRARPVPFALREQVETQLRSMVETGMLRQVARSDWATPLVVVPKKDGSLRLCGDYKVTINPVLKTDHYPLPRPEDLYSVLAGGKVFCVLDLSAAYQQVPLTPESRPFLTVNTSLGLFEFQRLPYGVASAPAIFQSMMDEVLKGIPHVGCYIDDVIVAGSDTADCQKTLERVLGRLREYNITLNADKCRFFQESVTYLGHTVTADGIYPTEAKKRAILAAPEPTTVTELKAYLGMLNFYSKFLQNGSTVAEPLYRLLKKDQKWSWTKECSEAFANTKKLLTSSQVLTFYDVDKPIGMLCDASSYGVGAVIFHETADGEERPIAFASRTLTPAEKKYAQCEREALALIFGLKKFHRYLFGREFTIYTDHQPLLGILGQERPVPTLAAARMQRWAMVLAAYKYRLKYRRGKNMEVADALSRLPQAVPAEEEPVECLSVFQCLPLNVEEIAKFSKRSLTLSRVAEFTLNGWPRPHAQELGPYYVRRDELSLEQGCVTWGVRVVIPEQLRDRVLNLLHEEHPGASRMKMLARSFVWWPGIDAAIEHHVQKCQICQAVQPAARPVPLHPWSYPARCWSRVHVDFASKGAHVFLVLIDSFSKWIEVWVMSSTSTTKTLEKLRGAFSAYGLPEVLVSDNGPQFTSAEFADFMNANGVKHIRTPPYHAASNGAAERTVQTVKRALLKQVLEGEATGRQCSLQENVDSFLICYRNTPNSVTGKTPAELFLRRQPRTKLSLLKPDFVGAMQRKQEHVKEQRDVSRGAERVFNVGDRVFVKTVRGECVSWEEGIVCQVVSAATYVVKVLNQLRFTHADHLRPRHAEPIARPGRTTVDDDPSIPPPTSFPAQVPSAPPSAKAPTLAAPPPDAAGTTPTPDATAPAPPADPAREGPATPTAATPVPSTTAEKQPLRRTSRACKPPDRFKPEDFRK